MVLSYFKYDQGDYLLDRFSFGAGYLGQGRQIHLHGFKRTYAGTFNQYSNETFQPIQQTYIISYESHKGKDNGGISLGHFNTLSGLADSTSRGLIDSRITTSNTFWNHDFGNFHSKISIDQFLQRYRADHSISSFMGVRYSTRSRLVGELKWKGIVTAGTELNKRSVRQDSLVTTLWNLFYLKGNISFIDLKIGITQMDDKSNINYQFGLKYLTFIPSTLYGPYYNIKKKQLHFIFDIIRKVLDYKENQKEIILWGDGTQKRELVFVEDFVIYVDMFFHDSIYRTYF